MNDLLYILQPIVLMVLAGLWVACIVDALREHRPWVWVLVLVFVPVSFPLYYLNFRVWGRGDKGLIDAHLADSRRLHELTEELKERDVAGVRRDLADILFRRGNFRGALEHLRPALDFAPEDLRSQYQAGVALLGIGRPELARTHLEFVVEEDPKYQRGEARLALARTFLALNQSDLAFDQLAVLVEEFSLPEGAVRFARLLVQQGYRDRARQTLETLFDRLGGAPERGLPPGELKWLRTARRELDEMKNDR